MAWVLVWRDAWCRQRALDPHYEGSFGQRTSICETKEWARVWAPHSDVIHYFCDRAREDSRPANEHANPLVQLVTVRSLEVDANYRRSVAFLCRHIAPVEMVATVERCTGRNRDLPWPEKPEKQTIAASLSIMWLNVWSLSRVVQTLSMLQRRPTVFGRRCFVGTPLAAQSHPGRLQIVKVLGVAWYLWCECPGIHYLGVVYTRHVWLNRAWH